MDNKGSLVTPDHEHFCGDCGIMHSGFNPNCKEKGKPLICGRCVAKRFADDARSSG